jgi:hypothetical protein
MLFFLCFSAAPKQYDSSGKHTYLKVCKQEGIAQSQSFMRIIIISATWYFRIFLSFCCHRDSRSRQQQTSQCRITYLREIYNPTFYFFSLKSLQEILFPYSKFLSSFVEFFYLFIY